MGLRALGHRAMLVAHPSGELRRRADEGLDLVPLAPRTEMDLSAAWRLSRVIKQLKPDIVHAHDPHGVAMAALALSMSTQLVKPPLVAARRVDFHLRGNSLSRWKYRQVDCFICASEAIRQMLVADGMPAARAVTVHEGIDLGRVDAAPPANLHEELWLPHQAPIVGNVAALVPHKGQRHLIEAARAGRCRRCRMRGSSSPAKGSCGRRSNARSRSTTSRSTCCSPASGPTCCRCTRRSTSSSMSSVTEGLGHVAARRDGLRQAGRRDQRPAASRRWSSTARPDFSCRRAITRRWRRAIVRLLKDEALRQRMGDSRPARGRRQLFSAERMVQDTLRVYERVAMHPHQEDDEELST